MGKRQPKLTTICLTGFRDARQLSRLHLGTLVFALGDFLRGRIVGEDTLKLHTIEVGGLNRIDVLHWGTGFLPSAVNERVRSLTGRSVVVVGEGGERLFD